MAKMYFQEGRCKNPRRFQLDQTDAISTDPDDVPILRLPIRRTLALSTPEVANQTKKFGRYTLGTVRRSGSGPNIFSQRPTESDVAWTRRTAKWSSRLDGERFWISTLACFALVTARNGDFWNSVYIVVLQRYEDAKETTTVILTTNYRLSHSSLDLPHTDPQTKWLNIVCLDASQTTFSKEAKRWRK
ncbi:MAG: hypothetical protein M1817_000889 [Caeruleum heppii]|nr:MAG: hypothetical protein M1817_000889 [Caeruleum heppii]